MGFRSKYGVKSSDETALYHGSGLGRLMVYWASVYAGGNIDIDATEQGTGTTLSFPAKRSDTRSDTTEPSGVEPDGNTTSATPQA